MKIAIVVDNHKSWMNKYRHELISEIRKLGEKVYFCREHEEIKEGDVAIFLSCEKMVPKEILEKNKHNLVVHGSALPEGKGWSPMTWRVLAGEDEMFITLFEIEDKVDSGDIYYQNYFTLEGHELIDEMREINRRYNRKPEVKKKKREYDKKYREIPEIKERRKEQNKIYYILKKESN